MLSVILVGCPLPFEFSGEGARATERDPASPQITAPVAFAYAEQGNGSGTLPDGGRHVAGVTTTVTLSTQTPGAVIYYSIDGNGIIDLNSANRIDASSGSFVVARTASDELRDIAAVAVGPNMRPSPVTTAIVEVSSLPILTIAGAPSAIGEDGGAGAFIVSTNVAPDSDLTVNLTTDGSYTSADVDWIGPAAGSSFTATLPAGQTSVRVALTAKPTQENRSVAVGLTIDAGVGYAVGSRNRGQIVVTDNGVPVLTLEVDKTAIDDNSSDAARFTVISSIALTSDLTVKLETGGSYDDGDLDGVPGPNSDFGVTLPANSLRTSFEITASPDLGDYGPETVSVTLQNDTAYTPGTPATQQVTINDSSQLPELTIATAAVAIADTASAPFTITAVPAPEVDTEVTMRADGTYELGDAPGLPLPGLEFTRTIPAGVTNYTWSVVGQADTDDAADERVEITLQPGSGYAIVQPSQDAFTFLDTDTTVTDLYVDAVNGSDINNGTSAQFAFRTITRAMSFASSGRKVRVAPGTYDLAHEGTLPIVVPAGVTLIGNEANKGDGGRSTTIVNTSDNVVSSSLTIGSGATIAGFVFTAGGRTATWALGVRGDNVTLRNNTFRTALAGVLIEDGATNVVLDGNVITNMTSTGVNFASNSSGLLRGNRVSRTAAGVVVQAQASVHAGGSSGAGGNTFSCNRDNDFRVRGTGVVVASDNFWDHVPPTREVGTTHAGVDISTPEGATVSAGGARLAPGACD